MNRRSMTEGERKILDYARAVLDGPRDPEVSERIARVYRNLLLRSRAHAMEEVQENIKLLEGTSATAEAGADSPRDQSDGAYLAFYTLLAHDQIAALSLVNRIGEKQLPAALNAALAARPGASATLYGLWYDVTGRLSEATVEAAAAEWVTAAANYSRSMMPANPAAALTIWQQAVDWDKKFPSEGMPSLLTETASAIISATDQSLGRMNEALWEFVREQDGARSAPGPIGQATRIASLSAALKMTQAEIARPDNDETAVREIWDAALPWMTEDLPSHPAWAALEVGLGAVTAKPRAALVPVGERLALVSQGWAERYGGEVQQSIRLAENPAPWVDRPVYSADWREVESEDEVRSFLWQLALPGRVLADRSRLVDRVRVTRPSFYPGQTLVEMQAGLGDDTHAICSFLTSGRHPTAILAGQSPPIHAVNAGGLLRRMDEEGVALDYMRFFCSYVWGDSGPFRIVESTADVPLADTAGEVAAATVARLIEATPCTIKPLPPADWEIIALVCYQNALFKARFKVEPTGMVSMIEDEPLAADLPIRRIVMRDGFRLYDDVWDAASGSGGAQS